ncbi:14298_t:CDS:2 [Entrophospora sp. SA101]|nr:14298_t:CDS:2 [Entrophospora sp. SA101]
MKLLQRTTGRSPRTVVAYGDVFFSSSSRGDPSGPKKGLFLQLKKTTGRSPRTVVAYGDVFFSSSSRGDPSGPKKGLFLQLKKYVGLGNMMNSKLPLSVLAVMDKWRMLARFGNL